VIPRLFLSSFPRDLHSSHVFPTNEWPGILSVNGEDLTHSDVPYYSYLRPSFDGEDKGANRSDVFRGGIRWCMLMKNRRKNGTVPSRISSAKVYWMDKRRRRWRPGNSHVLRTWMQIRIILHGAQPSPAVTVGKSAGKTLMDPFLRTRSRIARVRRPLLRTMQKPTRVNATVVGEGVRRNGGEKVGGTVLRTKCNESKERQIKHETDNHAI